MGSSEQGIENPVEQSEVRGASTKFKGVGLSVSDPFEQFRQNRSQKFIQRMANTAKAREGQFNK